MEISSTEMISRDEKFLIEIRSHLDNELEKLQGNQAIALLSLLA